MEQNHKSLFEVKVKSEQQLPDGVWRKVSQIFIVESVSVTDAEARTVEELEGATNINVLSAKKTNYVGVLAPGGDTYFFKTKLSYIQLDEVSGKPQSASYEVLVRADSIQEALQTLQQSVQDSIANHRILSIVETNIVDVIDTERKLD